VANDEILYWQEYTITAKPKIRSINTILTRDKNLMTAKFNKYFMIISTELTKDTLYTIAKEPGNYLNGIYF